MSKTFIGKSQVVPDEHWIILEGRHICRVTFAATATSEEKDAVLSRLSSLTSAAPDLAARVESGAVYHIEYVDADHVRLTKTQGG